MCTPNKPRGKMHFDLVKQERIKDLTGGQDRKRLHRAKSNGEWLSTVPHRLNGMDLSREEFHDNICLKYGLITKDIPATCDGCGKKFSIEHALLFPKGDLVLAQNDDAAKEWGALGSWDLVPSVITYKQKINCRTVQGGGLGAGTR